MSMNRPDKKSFTTDWAPKPNAIPPIPAPAMSGPRFMSSWPKVMRAAKVQIAATTNAAQHQADRSGPGFGPGRFVLLGEKAAGAPFPQRPEPVGRADGGDALGEPGDGPLGQLGQDPSQQEDEGDADGAVQYPLGPGGQELVAGPVPKPARTRSYDRFLRRRRPGSDRRLELATAVIAVEWPDHTTPIDYRGG